MQPEPFSPGNYYHIYNRGNNSSRIFFEDDNYRHFLRLYDKYMPPVADTFAWCLMRNHFHVLLYLKLDEEIPKESYLTAPGKEPKKPNASRQIGHLFNAYSQAINRRYNRTGSLFEKPFERKKVDSEDYFKQLVYYIHNNPVHHGVTSQVSQYSWSSYKFITDGKKSTLRREEVIRRFDSLENFIAYHEGEHNLEKEFLDRQP